MLWDELLILKGTLLLSFLFFLFFFFNAIAAGLIVLKHTDPPNMLQVIQLQNHIMVLVLITMPFSRLLCSNCLVTCSAIWFGRDLHPASISGPALRSSLALHHPLTFPFVSYWFTSPEEVAFLQWS